MAFASALATVRSHLISEAKREDTTLIGISSSEHSLANCLDISISSS